jgi:tol-pal system protein YbgF
MKTSYLSKSGICGLGLVIVLSLAVASCATYDRQFMYLNDQIAALNTRVNKMEESLGGEIAGKFSSQLDSKVASLRESQADLGAELDKIRGDLQELSGRVQENRHLVKRAIERDTTEQDVTKASLPELSRRIDELEARVKQLQGYVGLEPGVGQRKTERKEALATEKTPEKRIPVTEEPPVSEEKRRYDLILAEYQKGNYQEALSGFTSFLEKYPTSKLADNAQFWIGECYLSLKQYEQAILAYQEVIKKYPTGNKVANAMLRQAVAFYELKDTLSARLLLKKIIREYPNSSEAKIARTRLNSLK